MHKKSINVVKFSNITKDIADNELDERDNFLKKALRQNFLMYK